MRACLRMRFIVSHYREIKVYISLVSHKKKLSCVYTKKLITLKIQVLNSSSSTSIHNWRNVKKYLSVFIELFR